MTRMKYRSEEAYLHGLRGNIWKSAVFTGIQGVMLVMPIIVLFFQEIGLSMTQVFLSQAWFSLLIVSLEIPAGYFSDRVGRRKTMILGAWALLLG